MNVSSFFFIKDVKILRKLFLFEFMELFIDEMDYLECGALLA